MDKKKELMQKNNNLASRLSDALKSTNTLRAWVSEWQQHGNVIVDIVKKQEDKDRIKKKYDSMTMVLSNPLSITMTPLAKMKEHITGTNTIISGVEIREDGPGSKVPMGMMIGAGAAIIGVLALLFRRRR